MERPDGTKIEQFGPNPKGILIFAPDGHFATVNARADLPKLASANRSRATPEETKAVVEGSLAYYGTYSVSDSEKLTVHVEGSTFAN
jgi:lipocalin-like protein